MYCIGHLPNPQNFPASLGACRLFPADALADARVIALLREEGLRLSWHHQLGQEKHDFVMIWALMMCMAKLIALSTLKIRPLVAFLCTSLCKAVPMIVPILLTERAELESSFLPLAFDL